MACHKSTPNKSLWWLCSRCLPNPCQSDICHREGVASFHDVTICILRTLLSGWSFLLMMCTNCGAIAVIASMTYMTIMELFDEYLHPAPSPLRW